MGDVGWTRRDVVSGLALGALARGAPAAEMPQIEPRRSMRATALPVIVSAGNGHAYLDAAYRRLHEGKPLPRWHPLITGDPESVHRAGVSVRGKTISENALEHPDDALDFEAPEFQRDGSDD